MQIGSYGANAPAQTAFDSLFSPSSTTASTGSGDLFATLIQSLRGAGTSGATASTVPVPPAGVDADGDHDGSTTSSSFEAGLSRIRSLFQGGAASAASSTGASTGIGSLLSALDTNGDGSISPAELTAGVKALQAANGAAATTTSAPAGVTAAVSTSTSPATATNPITTTATASADVLIRQRQLEQLLLNAYTSNFKIHQFDSGISMTGSAAASAALAA